MKLRKTFLFFDTLVFPFHLLRTEKALRFGISEDVAVVMEVYRSCGRRTPRHTLNEIAIIFKKEIYTSVYMFGATVFLLLSRIDLEWNDCFLASVFVILLCGSSL